MKVLVTGGAGFIGSHVVRLLLKAGHDVRVLHLKNENLENIKELKAQLIAGDITNPQCLKEAMFECDWVFHIAAVYALWTPDPELMYRVNVIGTKNVLTAAREAGVKRVIYTSTCACFAGQPYGKISTETSPFALGKTGDKYVLTKYEAQQVALAAAKEGQDVVIVCPTVPIGPNDIGPTPTGKLVLTAARLPIMAVPGSMANLVDVRDVAAGHLLAAERGIKGEVYILGNENMSTAEMIRRVHKELGVKRPVFTLPRHIESISTQAVGHAALWVTENITKKPPIITPSAAKVSLLGVNADCSKAIKFLGLPQTPIEIAIRDSLKWFTENGYL